MFPVFKSIKNAFCINRMFLLFMFIYSYLVVVKGRISSRSGFDWYVLTPEGPLATFISGIFTIALLKLFMQYFAIEKELKTSLKNYIKLFACTLATSLLIGNLLSFAIALLFNNIERNFNQVTFVASNLSSVIDFAFFASLYLAYDFINKAASYREKIATYNAQLAEVKLQQVRAQIDPHFIFNCLNTLDELIEQDKTIASDYLNEFADLYRLAIEHSGKSLVPLKQEIQFAKLYFQLMQQRLPTGYTLNIQEYCSLTKKVIPPFTLQLLVENALLHNKADKQSGIAISIDIDSNIRVSNTYSPLAIPRKGSGTGLTNIVEQYQYLTEQSVNISQQNGVFCVTLPHLEQDNDV